MSRAPLLLRLPVAGLPIAAPGEWRAAVHAGLQAGGRVLTLFGRSDGDDVVVTAVLAPAGASPAVLRTRVPAARGYHALTADHPGLHCFERELHEQTGLPLRGHPWLKPLRYPAGGQAAMASHPFWRLQGKEVHEVAVGPIHAGVIEPGAFRFSCLGEQVHHLEIQLGYQHRGAEARLCGGDPRRALPLVESLAGDTAVAHAWAWCSALEALADVEPPPAVDAARAVALEWERVAMHLAGLAGLATDIAFLQGATTYGRLRTTAINTTMRLCGNRFGRGAIRPGGVGMASGAALRAEILAAIRLLQHDLGLVDELFFGARTVLHRLRGIGTLTTPQALELGLVGMAARSAGVAIDARVDAPSGIYRDLPLAAVVLPTGDCLARARLRADELGVSLAWLARALECHPGWPAARLPVGPLAPAQLVVAVVEGWRGEVVHCLETGADGTLVQAKVQDPSLRNWLGLALCMRGNEISDFPICNKSFDLSYCGHDL